MSKSPGIPKEDHDRPFTHHNNNGVLLPDIGVGGKRGNPNGLSTGVPHHRAMGRVASARPLGSAPRRKVPRALTQSILARQFDRW